MEQNMFTLQHRATVENKTQDRLIFILMLNPMTKREGKINFFKSNEKLKNKKVFNNNFIKY